MERNCKPAFKPYAPWFAPMDRKGFNELKMDVLDGGISLKEMMRRSDNSAFEFLTVDGRIPKRTGDLRPSMPILFVTVKTNEILTRKLVAVAHELSPRMQLAILKQKLWETEDELIDYVRTRDGVSEETRKLFANWKSELRERMKTENDLLWHELDA